MRETKNILPTQEKKVSFEKENIVNSSSSSLSSKEINPLDPDEKKINLAISKYLFKRLDMNNDMCPSEFDILNEDKHPVDSVFFKQISEKEIFNFVRKFQKISWADPISLILGIIFLKKLLEKHQNIPFNRATWKRLFIGSVVLGLKIWSDYSIYLLDFQDRLDLPFLKIKSLYQIEYKFLSLLNFEVEWAPSDYEKTLVEFGFSF